MSIEIKTPALPESVSDATIAAWHKKAGDSVRRGENLLDLETDKVVLEVPAPEDGILQRIVADTGATVTAGQVLAVLEPGAVAAKASGANSKGNPGDTSDATVTDHGDEHGGHRATSAVAAAPTDNSADSDSKKLSPAVRRLLQERNINTAAIQGSGKDGRILKEDVLRYFQQQAMPADADVTSDVDMGTATPAAAQNTSGHATSPLPASAPTGTATRNERREPLSRIRQTIARRLVEAQQRAAILSTFNEVNLSAVLALRKHYGDDFAKRYGTRLGLMPFFVAACVRALQQFPSLNAYLEGGDIVYHDYCDIGIAVSSPRGLVVPVLRNAEALSFADIELQIRKYGEQAADGSLDINDLGGGTFSITNGGVFGSLLSTPIINPPQSAILGMHTIQQRPVAEDGNVVIRPMMYVALSYDHRIIDGREAVQSLLTIKTALEEPQRMLLGL